MILKTDRRPTEKIRVITTDGCLYTAKLLGYDNTTNLMVEDVWEIVIPSAEDFDEEKERTDHIFKGGQVIRGENVVCIGVVDEEEDGELDWSALKGELGSTVNT